MFSHAVRRSAYAACVLEPEVDANPLLDDLRATRGEASDGSVTVVVEGVWNGAAGGPPPVLHVDDGSRRHTLAALDAPPPDDPLAFRATFSVPAELAGALGDGVVLGIGAAQMPVAFADPVQDAWLQGPPVLARRLEPAPAPAGTEPQPPEPGEELTVTPGRRFERSVAGHGAIAAAILRATAAPEPEPEPEPGSEREATVVERSVIAERRARRSEQLAAVMERRARGAEVTAQELGRRIAALEARIAEISAERDRLAAELELQRAAMAQAQAAREAAEARLAQLLEAEASEGGRPAAEAAPQAAPAEGAQEASTPETAPEPETAAPAGAEIAAVRGLPGLEEAARALRDQEPPRPAPTPVAENGADPFADALAKLRSGREDIAAVAAAAGGPERLDMPAPPPPQPAPRVDVAAAVARPATEHVVPYLISARHPRTPWLAGAITALDARDREAAARLVAALLPAQALGTGRALVYDLHLEGLGALRVELDADGTGRALPREGDSADAAFALYATPAELARLVAGGAPLWPRGLRVERRRMSMPLVRLARRRRKPVRLADLVTAGIALDPALAIRALACAVPPEWTAGHAFGVTVLVEGRDACRVRVQDRAPLQVTVGDGPASRPAVAVAAVAAGREPSSAALAGEADAVLRVSERGALPLLAHAEPPADEEPATVLGDLAAATTLLSWFDRVQGLTPRA